MIVIYWIFDIFSFFADSSVMQRSLSEV